MYWLERNLSQEQEGTVGNPTIDNQRDKKGKVSRGATNPTPPTDLLAKCSKKLGDIWSLSYVTSADTSGGGISSKTSSLRRVSFAPCNQADEAGPSSPAMESVDIVSSSSDDKDCEVSEMLRVPSTPDREELQVSGKSPVSEDLKTNNQLHVVQTANVYNGKLVGAKSPMMKPLREEVVTHSVKQEAKEIVKKPEKRKKTAKSKGKSLYYLEPRLPPRDYPPPSPPADVRHYTRSTNPGPLDRKTQSDDDCLSYHIKKKLLALKLQEKASKKSSRDRLLGMSSLNSSRSDDIDEDKELCESASLSRRPIFHSTPDSSHSLIDDAESIPTVYYTPKQSMVTCCSQDLGGSDEMPIITSSPLTQEDEATSEKDASSDKSPSNAGSTVSSSTHTSLNSSCSAPSFLIGSSTQLCQCIGNSDDDSNEKFKRVLDKLTTSGNQGGTESSNKKLCLVDESWWEKFEKSYPEDSIDELSADEDILDSEASSGSPSVSYHQIDLEDLLSQIYHGSTLHSSVDSSKIEVEEAGESVVNTSGNNTTAESGDNTTAESGDNTRDSCRLESLVDFLCGTSDPGDLTTYVQKEMSLEDIENDGMDLPIETRAGTPFELPPQHITIEMPEEASFFSSVGATIATRSERSPVTSPFFGSNTQSFDLTNSADSSKVDNDTKDSQAFCDDLIDITFESDHEKKMNMHSCANESEGNALPQTSDDWTDVSAEYLIASLPTNISLEGDSSNISQLESSQETSQGSLDFSLDSSMKKKLTVDFKRGSEDAKTLAQLKKMSPEPRKDATDVGLSSLVKDSLCSATDILERSHDSLAKSVHGLCRRAIIKQSNVSLELILPTEKLHALDVDGEEGVKYFNTSTSPPKVSGMLSVQLNSSITYPPSDGQALQKVKRD